ncbi:uncharacterized protein LOC142339809 [Convolutriloba macropyga]|uniref:uncharacterized protein LOC142339809 n=1 Tax=Convolutriloba macropyga TaxID=536237 RepID=UPI003F52439B
MAHILIKLGLLSPPSAVNKLSFFSYTLVISLTVLSCVPCCVSGKVTWYDCLKSAFYKEAKLDFEAISRKTVIQPGDTNVKLWECDIGTRGYVGNLFQKYFQNQTLMEKDNTCKKMASGSGIAREMLSLSQVLEPICNREPQKLFDEQFNGGTPISVESMQGFMDALGLTEELCPMAEEFKEEMLKCNNSVAQLADMSLENYLKQFCLGYKAQRKCYEITIKQYCPTSTWKIPYDRTRAPNFEDVCKSASSAFLKSTNLLIIVTAVLSFMASKSQF